MTSANRHIALSIALAAVTLALAACNRPSTDTALPADAAATSTPAEAASTPETPPATIAPDAKPSASAALPNDVISEVPNEPGPTGIDPRAMAGRFSGGGTALTLSADGTYTLAEQGRTTSGTWSGEQNGRELLLDPDAKTDADRRYQRIDNDNLRSADTAGIALQRDGVVSP